MGTVAVKIKIMPSSPETDLDKIKDEVKKKMEREDVKKPMFEVQPVAFGLKSLIITFGWPEEKELEKFEDSLKEIKDVNSVEIIDMRRAVG